MRADTHYIIEKTYDGVGWVAGFDDGSMVITWDNMNFLKTIHVMFSSVPESDQEAAVQIRKMESLVEWLSDHHFDKMHRDI